MDIRQSLSHIVAEKTVDIDVIWRHYVTHCHLCKNTTVLQPVATCRQLPYLRPAIITMTSFSLWRHSRGSRWQPATEPAIYIIKIESVCLCRAQHAFGDRRYFLAACDNRPPATPARIPIGDTLCGYRASVSVSSAL